LFEFKEGEIRRICHLWIGAKYTAIAFGAIIGFYSFHVPDVSGDFTACKIYVARLIPILNASSGFHSPGYLHDSKIIEGRFEILLNFGGLFEGALCLTTPVEWIIYSIKLVACLVHS